MVQSKFSKKKLNSLNSLRFPDNWVGGPNPVFHCIGITDVVQVAPDFALTATFQSAKELAEAVIKTRLIWKFTEKMEK
jgi:hypothetical protein